MKLYLVRHARALPRTTSGSAPRGAIRSSREQPGGPERGDRHLDERGRLEAEALARHLVADPPTQIWCAPDTRCIETMQALARRSDIELSVEAALGRDGDFETVIDLLHREAEGPIAICTHAAVIQRILSDLEIGEPDTDERPPCKKGSLWILDTARPDAVFATYLEPVRRGKPKGSVEYTLREIAGPETIRAAVLDMGSTSFTLQIADIGADGSLEPVLRDKEMLRLGAVIAPDGRIPENVCSNAERVARELHALALQEKARIFLPVATAAVRDATNGRELALRISRAIREPVRILSGQQEARIMFEAFRRRIDLGRKPVLGVDLGGGSLELAVGHDHQIDAEVTLRLGVVRLHSELVRKDPMTRAEMKAIRARVREAVAPVKKQLGTDARFAVATGGTTRALAKLILERRGDREVEGMILSREELARLRDELVASSHEERLAMPGMRRRRADLVPTGAIVLSTLARELDLDGYRICDWGLREGVLFEAVGGRSS